MCAGVQSGLFCPKRRWQRWPVILMLATSEKATVKQQGMASPVNHLSNEVMASGQVRTNPICHRIVVGQPQWTYKSFVSRFGCSGISAATGGRYQRPCQPRALVKIAGKVRSLVCIISAVDEYADMIQDFHDEGKTSSTQSGNNNVQDFSSFGVMFNDGTKQSSPSNTDKGTWSHSASVSGTKG